MFRTSIYLEHLKVSDYLTFGGFDDLHHGHNPRRLPPPLLATIELFPLLGYPWTGGRSGMDIRYLVRSDLKDYNFEIVCSW